MSASSLINRLQLNDELVEMTQFSLKKKCSGAWCVNLANHSFSHHAEYDSHDIINYLNDINNVPEGYDMGKLCTEEPSLQAVLTEEQNHNQGECPGNSGSLNTRITVLLTTMCSYQS